MSGHVLLKDMIFSRIRLTGGHANMRTGFIGWQVCRRACITGGHVVWEGMSCRRTHLMGRHVLWEVMYNGETFTPATFHWI